uniref:Uncharacterized protein n=1 Tax=Globodera rostochiensis TaxID=31243 RepID=A0A914GSK8_GLORO
MIPILFGLLRAPNRADTERAGAQSCAPNRDAPNRANRARPIVIMKGRVTARQQRACGDGASSGGGGRSLTSATGGRARGDPRSGRARDPQPGHARTSSGARPTYWPP